MKKDLISVIIPVYNTKVYLEKCVESVCRQSYSELEILLIDDGSTDGSPALCDRLARQDARIRVIHKANGGLSDARNRGIESSQGGYLFFLDSDDYIAPEALECLYAKLTETDSDMAMGNFSYVYGEEEDGGAGSPLRDEVLSPDEAYQKLFGEKGHFYVMACGKLYRKSIFSELRFPKGKLHEDEYMIHHVMGKCRRIVSTKKVVYYYVQRQDSIMGKPLSEGNLDGLEALYDRYEYFEQLGKKEYARKSARLFWWLANSRFSKLDYNAIGTERKRRITHMSRKLLESMLRSETGCGSMMMKLFFVLCPEVYCRRLYRRDREWKKNGQPS
ncbi:MAG: glycosyltransferase family 2 protein [Eubacteriales bacterium]|nr:glycosyltransferase family 2 protein [Eubacteriales bacterium]